MMGREYPALFAYPAAASTAAATCRDEYSGPAVIGREYGAAPTHSGSYVPRCTRVAGHDGPHIDRIGLPASPGPGRQVFEWARREHGHDVLTNGGRA